SYSANTSIQILTDGSLVWYFFEPPVIKDAKRKAKCQLCIEKETYLILNKGSTTSLHSHITNAHHINIAEAISSKNFPVVSQSSKNVLRQALIKWITMDSLPFITVESESFWKLADIIRKLDDNITIHSTRTVKRDLLG
ncbi:22078_t:CDS:1, partial [Racocetra persica]